MKIVIQIRVTQKEAVVFKREPSMLENLSILLSVTMETAQRTADKPIVGEIVIENTGEVLARLP